MALETFKARLKFKAKALGVNLSQKRIDAIADRLHKKNPELTDELEHDSKIDDFNDLQPLADIAKQDDHVRTLENKAKGQQPPSDDQEPADDEDEPAQPAKGKGKGKNSEEPPAWAKAMQEELKALRTEKVQGTMKTKAAELLKGVPEKFYAGRALPEKEEDLEVFVETVKSDYTGFQQDLINQGLMSATTPTGGEAGKVNEKAFDASVDAWVSSKVEKKPTT